MTNPNTSDVHPMIWELLHLHTILALLFKGGVLMFPLILFSILALWIFLERWSRLKQAHVDAEHLYDSVRHLVCQDEHQAAHARVRQQPGSLAAVFSALLEVPTLEKTDLEEVAVMQARRELYRLTRRLPLLRLIATLTPLIGLLGTVIGMVKAFQQVAISSGAVNPAMLAGGIWEALLTTVAGLSVAIPSLMFVHVLDQRVKRYAFEMDHYGTALIQLLSAAHRNY